MSQVVPIKHDEVRDAILFKTSDEARRILQEYVDSGVVYDYVVDGNTALIKYGKDEEFWIIAPK